MKNIVFFSVLSLVILALALASGSVLMLRLFSLVVLVLLLSYLWMLLGIRGLTVQVKESSERCQVGEWFDEEVTVSSSSRIPKPLIRVQENTDFPGHNNIAAFSLPPKGSYRWNTGVCCRRRGQYHLGTLTATVADPFGFFSRSLVLGEPQSIIVYPATLELPFFWLLSRNEAGPGSSRWLVGEMGPDAARVREYTSGDNLRRIHWHSTAHIGRLMVKEFDADRSSSASKDIWVVLDMNQAAQAGAGDDSTEEYGVTIAASLLKNYVDDGRQVGLVASGEKPYLFLPQMEDHHFWRILEALALMKATGEVPLERLILQEVDRFDVNSVVIVITPAANERLVASLRRVKSRGAIVIVILLDSASFGGTVGTKSVAGSFASAGFPVCIMRRGDELARALDSRAFILR